VAGIPAGELRDRQFPEQIVEVPGAALPLRLHGGDAVAELRFNAMAASLPADEGAALRAAHDAALDRYYESLSPPL
jgi:hypothetical protein